MPLPGGGGGAQSTYLSLTHQQVTKKSWRDDPIGIGVSTRSHGPRRIQSEFDFLSASAFHTLEIRQSVHGIDFQTWLPLPISRGHWRQVSAGKKTEDGRWRHVSYGKKEEDDAVARALKDIRAGAGLGGAGDGLADVVVAFMNDVVVQLNESLQNGVGDGRTGYRSRREGGKSKSTLRHASEKAVEAYFQLFHLLVCMAVDDPQIVQKADNTIKKFLNGKTSK